eukprot:1605177-Rhodomonas_salina.1
MPGNPPSSKATEPASALPLADEARDLEAKPRNLDIAEPQLSVSRIPGRIRILVLKKPLQVIPAHSLVLTDL